MIVVNQIVLYNLHCPSLPYRIQHTLCAIAIMGFGKLYRTYEVFIDKWLVNWKVAIISSAIYFPVLYSYPVRILYWGHANWCFAVLIPFTGMLVMLYLSKNILNRAKFFLFIGSNTLLYFVLHRHVLKMLVEPVTNRGMLLLGMEASVWTNLTETIITAIVLALPVYVINQYFPLLMGKGWKLWTT